MIKKPCVLDLRLKESLHMAMDFTVFLIKRGRE
jgi:hypothetical protein